MDLPGFLHAIVNIAFWKFVASGSLRTLPRAVGLVVDSIAAALLVSAEWVCTTTFHF